MLTTAQKTTLKTDILADPAFNGVPNSSDGHFAIAEAYNQVVAPDFWVWRSAVTKAELTNATSVDGTTFNWTGAGFITRSQGERDAWRELFTGSENTVNPSLPSVRQALGDIFSGGTAPAPANRTHLLTIARRKASRIEKLLGSGTGSTASPATMTFEGPLSYQDVADARNS